jgi:hypothetical protein
MWMDRKNSSVTVKGLKKFKLKKLLLRNAGQDASQHHSQNFDEPYPKKRE